MYKRQVSNRGRRSVAKRLESLGGIGEVAAIIDDTGRWYFATVLYDTTAVPDAKQRMIQQYYCTRMIQRYEQDTAEINARTAEKLFVNECVSSDSPTDLGPKIFVDVRVTTNLHWQIFPEGP